MIRRILWLSLALAPLVIALDAASALSKTLLFAIAALSLVPLAWLIGEATEHLAKHTGAGIGGFLNATFGNAPELIIALFAVSNGLAGVVRGSLTGSIVSNLLLVLGASLVFGKGGRIDRTSSFTWLGLIALSLLFFLVPAGLAWTGRSSRQVTALSTVPVSIALTWLYFRRRSILASGTLHASFNGLIQALSLLSS